MSKLYNKDLQQLYFLYDPHSSADEETKREVIIPSFIIPDKVAHQYAPNFVPNSLLGRLSPILLYSGGSPRTLAFTIILNEDIINTHKSDNRTDYTSLKELVDDIKSLSYPKNDNHLSGLVKFPTVYFQLGELSGYGIIQTSINWKKPFDVLYGNYKMVEISFDITIEEVLAIPSVRQAREVYEDGTTTVYDSDMVIASELSREDLDRIKASLESRGFETAIHDFVSPYDDSELFLVAKQAHANQVFSYQLDKLSRILGAFSNVTHTNSYNSLRTLAEISEPSYDLTSENSNLAADIKKAKQEFRNYLNVYYNDISKTMTRDDYYKILDNVFSILETLESTAEEVSKYGSSS